MKHLFHYNRSSESYALFLFMSNHVLLQLSCSYRVSFVSLSGKSIGTFSMRFFRMSIVCKLLHSSKTVTSLILLCLALKCFNDEREPNTVGKYVNSL
mmetsp:Transcript_2275/g.4209  ORF Transcript_2275/g.4209 Transcript_2275/m.4209 type:complete len:97 (-) Transcript_2275:2799-3089(-)